MKQSTQIAGISIFPQCRFAPRTYITVSCAVLVMLFCAQLTLAQTFKTLYRFGAYNDDGESPVARVTLDDAGNLYGTTELGGNLNSYGTVFRLDAEGNESILLAFSPNSAVHGPEAGVLLDSQGNFYGTTPGGVYKLDASGNETVLHTFTFGKDGGDSLSDLTMDNNGNLYGTTESGGTVGQGCGVVFRVSETGEYSTLHIFQGPDGCEPQAGLLLEKDALYGTTSSGGTSSEGTIFKLEGSGKLTLLHNFTGGADGGSPTGALIADAEGNLYGTASSGGDANKECPQGCGVLFKLAPNGQETVLHAFNGSSDGRFPQAALVVGPRGYLYGVALEGGSAHGGTLFSIETTGSQFFVVHAFEGVPQGEFPESSLAVDGNGNIYGTTEYGGLPSREGTVFEVQNK